MQQAVKELKKNIANAQDAVKNARVALGKDSRGLTPTPTLTPTLTSTSTPHAPPIAPPRKKRT
jgi:hypothetical protein